MFEFENQVGDGLKHVRARGSEDLRAGLVDCKRVILPGLNTVHTSVSLVADPGCAGCISDERQHRRGSRKDELPLVRSVPQADELLLNAGQFGGDVGAVGR